MNFVDIVFASLLANNFLFFHYLGLGEFLSETGAAAVGKRVGILAVFLVACSAGYAVVDHNLLVPFHLEFLRTAVLFVLLGLGTLIYSALLGSAGPWPPAREFLVHSLVVGGVLLVGSNADLLEVVTAAVAVVIGYGGALVLLAAVFSRLAREKIPGFIQGLPLQLLTLGLVWLVLQGMGLAFAGKAA